MLKSVHKLFLNEIIRTVHIDKYAVSHAFNYGMPFEEKSDVNQTLQSRYGNTKRSLVIEKTTLSQYLMRANLNVRPLVDIAIVRFGYC